MKLNKIIFVLITSLVLLSDLLPPAHNMYAKENGNAKPVITELSDDDNVIITQKQSYIYSCFLSWLFIHFA